MTKEFALGMVKISFTYEKESLIVYSLDVKGARIDTKNFAMLLPAVPMAERIGRRGVPIL